MVLQCGLEGEARVYLVLHPQKVWLSCVHYPGLYGCFSQLALYHFYVPQGDEIWKFLDS